MDAVELCWGACPLWICAQQPPFLLLRCIGESCPFYKQAYDAGLRLGLAVRCLTWLCVYCKILIWCWLVWCDWGACPLGHVPSTNLLWVTMASVICLWIHSWGYSNEYYSLALQILFPMMSWAKHYFASLRKKLYWPNHAWSCMFIKHLLVSSAECQLEWYILMLWSCGWSALSTYWVAASSCLPFSSWFSCWFWPFSSWVTPCPAPPRTAAVGLTFSSWDDLELQVTPWFLMGVIHMVWWGCGRTVCSFVCWGCACRLGVSSSWPSWSTPPAASLSCCGVDNTTPYS
jgi:hypothetical protein